MIKVKLLHEGRVVKKISSRVHESVILEQIKNYTKPFDEIVIIEGDLSEDAKSILKKVAKKIVPAAMAAGVALGGAAGAQAQGGANPHYPGLDRSIGQHISDIFSPNYQELMRQRRAERDTERRVWDAKQAEIRRARIERAREEGRAEAQGITGKEMSGQTRVYDQARLSQDGKYYNLYDLDHKVIRIPVAGTEFVPSDSQRLSHYITRTGAVYYVRHTPQTSQTLGQKTQEGLQEDPVVGTIPTGGTSSSTMKSSGTKSVGRSVVAPPSKPGSRPVPGTPKMAGQPDEEGVLTLDKNHGLDQKTLDDLEKAGIVVNIKEKQDKISSLEKRIRGIEESIEIRYLNEDANPMAQAVTGRILRQHPDWLSHYGAKAVLQAIDDVTEGESDWEEIGSSDVSAYVNMVHDRLRDRMGDVDAALRSRWNLGSSIVEEINEEFGTRYADRLAQMLYDKDPAMDTSGRAEELLDAGYSIASQELGAKRAHHLFAYDEDFVGDLIAAYAVMSQGKGVAEGHADQQRKIFKKNGKPVGEVGIDRESSPGAGQWYMKCYAYGIDNGGYDSYEEAVAELKHCLKQDVAETSDYSRRREREEAIISGKKPARKTAPAQTSDYARRREQEKKAGVQEGLSDIDIERQDWERMSPQEFQRAYGQSKEDWQANYDRMFNRLQSQTGQAMQRTSVKEGFTDPKLQDILDRYEDSWRAFKAGGEVDENPDFYDAVFNYFTDSEEMPYEVAKARTGDPIEWITDRLDILAGNEEVGEAQMNDFDNDQEATTADQAAADKNIIMQIRKAADYEQPTKIELADGSTGILNPTVAKKILTAFDRMRPDSKEFTQQMLNTKKGFDDIVQHLGDVKESLRPGEYHLATVVFDDGTEEKIKLTWDEGYVEPIKKHYAKYGKTVKDIKVDWGVRSSFESVEETKITQEAQKRVSKIMNEVFGL